MFANAQLKRQFAVEQTNMKNTIKTLAALGLIGASGAWLLRSRATKWQRESDAMIEKLNAVATDASPNDETVSFRDFETLDRKSVV